MKLNNNRIDFIVQIRHLAWCAYQLGAGQVFNPVINDDQLVSLRNGVEYQLKNPKVTPEENHDNWVKMKISQGWKYGPVKDFEKKEHPDLVPFKDLPEVERNKDLMDLLAHRKAVELWEIFSKIEGCKYCGEIEFETLPTSELYDDTDRLTYTRCKNCGAPNE